MTSETAKEILDDIEAAARANEGLKILKENLLIRVVQYARMRTDWDLASLDARVEMDRSRRVAHNALIDACNIMSRNMDKQGHSIAWRQRLGQNRKEIGDFACHLHCILGIRAR